MRDAIEIERKFLLSRAPEIPGDCAVERLELEQGYLPRDHRVGALVGGRLRRQVDDAGRVVLVHTVKTGAPPARREQEQMLSPEAFDAAWPATAPHRLRKTRLRVREPGATLVWEIDLFRDRDLVLAEVELPAPDHPVAIPGWLRRVLIREVTLDPTFGNAALAGCDRDPALNADGPTNSG